MAETVELILPALAIPDSLISIAAGSIRVPGAQIPEKRVTMDVRLLTDLLAAARAAATTAHAPHSHFHVGAA
ncbi:MAG: hypothetical protein P8N43_08385, partial [Alphaproteobacteria bacterium]|nr:hypothetical protein [Alphaproteobacteria bacterium]